MARWRLLLALAVAVSFCLAAIARDTDRLATGKKSYVERATGIRSNHHNSSLDDIIYYEDWESGDFAGWTPVDLSTPPSAWHRDDYDAFGGSGMSWWMGDSTVGPTGGYLDDWYMVLDSPPVALGATPGLLFWHRYHAEAPDYYQQYDGYDGMNIRVSTNNGVNWTVIPGNVVTPTYDRTSLYSFGGRWGEGVGIPGWCGWRQNWTLETVDLAQWANQTVKIRWAFASDENYCTQDSSALFGWMLDHIRVYSGTDTALAHDADSNGGFTPGTNIPAGGNLWRIATDATSPAGPHIVVCNNAGNNMYNPSMNNELISPLIDCSNLAYGVLMADFQITGSFPGCNPPDCYDFWGFEVSTNGGASWCYGSNPTCDTSGQNYVYPDTPPDWASFNTSYDVALDMSALIGNVLTFKFTFQSNADADVSVGPKFDGFQLFYQAGYPNDVSCYTLQVRFPNMVNRPTRIKAYFRNVGQEPEVDFPALFRVGSSAAQLFNPNLTLDPGATATRDTVITFTAPNLYAVRAYTWLSVDENLQNDTSMVDTVVVHAFSNALELGYDNRTIRWQFNYPTGSGALVHFTPVSDGIVGGSFGVTSVMAKFDAGQAADLPIQLHVYLGGATQPGTEVVDQAVTVLDSEADPDIWKVINTSGISQLQNINQDYWVWFEVTNTTPDPGDRYPKILGEDDEPWSDIHNYVHIGTNPPSQSAFFYQLHSVIDVGTAAKEVPGELPTVWALEQNYPNPFNPATDIRYSVPKAERMTLKVFNVVGQEVATLVNGILQPGVYTAKFDASRLPSGLYFYRLESENFTASHKMLLLK